MDQWVRGKTRDAYRRKKRKNGLLGACGGQREAGARRLNRRLTGRGLRA